jgi:hypothetical protein
MPDIHPELQSLRCEFEALRAYEAIRQRIYSYARALDRLDGPLLADQFWPDARIDYGSIWQGPAAGFIAVALRFQGSMRDTHHLVGQSIIQLDPNARHACAESYVHAAHVIEHETGRQQLVVGARYLDRFERRGAEWRILERSEVLDWGRQLPITESWFEQMQDMPKATRDRTDRSYRVLEG